MPLDGLRRRSSIRDLLRRPKIQNDTESFKELKELKRRSTGPGPLDTSRSESATSRRRPLSISRPGKNERSSVVYTSPNAPPLPGTLESRRSGFLRLSKRYASDSELSTRFREDAASRQSITPEGAPAPVIGVTAPPVEGATPPKKSRLDFFNLGRRQQSFRSKSSNAVVRPSQQALDLGSDGIGTANGNANSDYDTTSQRRSGYVSRPSVGSHETVPPPYGFDARSPPALPQSRPSESMASDRTSSEPFAFATTTTTHTISTTTTFFKIPRRRTKKPDSLFPLPTKQSFTNPAHDLPPSQSSSFSPSLKSSRAHSNADQQLSEHSKERKPSLQRSSLSIPAPHHKQQAISPVGPVARPPNPPSLSAPTLRRESTSSAQSASSSAVLPTPDGHWRRRSATAQSTWSGVDVDRASTPFHQDSGRNSATPATPGRNSIVGLKHLTTKFRYPSDINSARHSSPGGALGANGPASGKDSFTLSRETFTVPEREDGEPPGKYYTRLEREISKKGIALIMAKSSDPFSHDVLRSLMRTFKFYEEPMDMSLRRFLWEIKLPGEAQQIDRVMSAFAERYHECNPHIFNSFDQAFLAAYSLVILHSDLYNKSNKHKMQRHEYQKNTGGQGIDEEILGYFYDNIQYTEFIEQTADENDSASKGKTSRKAASKSRSRSVAPDGTKTGKLDPYDFIIDDTLKLDILRPSLKEVMHLDDSYSYVGSGGNLDTHRARGAFTSPAVLPIISVRSRPDAFTATSAVNKSDEADPALVEIRVAKVGIVLRKEVKKKKTRSPWQEWGVVLTASQLHFFRNTGWVRSLAHQTESYHKQKHKPDRLIFRPPLAEFRPDVSVPMDSAVALVNASYKKHKNAFVLIRHGKPSGGPHEDYFEDILLAENEVELNLWLTSINYAAAFTSTNIGMRHSPGLVKEELVDENLFQAEGSISSGSAHDPSIVRPSDSHLEKIAASSILSSRRTTIAQRISAIETSISTAQDKLAKDLKTARHLQILAPFPPKTRSDLLAVAARMAYRVKKSQFEVCRLKCQRDILERDMDEETGQKKPTTHEEVRPSPPRATGKTSALERLNSKASLVISPRKIAKQEKSAFRRSVNSVNRSLKEPDASSTIVEVAPKEVDPISATDGFATPPEYPSKPITNTDNPYKLPPLVLGRYPMSFTSDKEDYFSPSQTESSTVQQSSTSFRSQPDRPLSAPSEPRVANLKPSMRESEQDTPTENRPNTANESDKEHATVVSSPESRIRVRRSLQRSLRDGQGMHSGQHQRGKKGKESQSSAGVDEESFTQDSEGLPRSGGSFTVHGKKASVITLGSEWQQISAEERLRLRKQALSDSSAIEDENEDTEVMESMHIAQGSQQKFTSTRPLTLGDEGAVDYLSSKLYREKNERRSSISSLSEQEARDGEGLLGASRQKPKEG